MKPRDHRLWVLANAPFLFILPNLVFAAVDPPAGKPSLTPNR